MRFPFAVAMISIGYAAIYWAMQRFVAYQPGDGKPGAAVTLDPYAAPFSVLLGITRDGKNAQLQKVQTAPFQLGAYQGGTQTSSNNNPTKPNGGAQTV